jgi:cation diffusion facilitator CzcD-associated flavoprotein CzcO
LRQMMYPGFPNMYVMLGHNVAPGHTSVMINIEVQANYIAQVVKAQLQEGSKVIEVKEEPTRRYME